MNNIKSIIGKKYSGLIVAVIFAAVACLLWLRVPQERFQQSEVTGNVGELTQDLFVGQTFVAPDNYLSGVAVNIATYSGRNNDRPVVFDLKEWPGGQLLKTVTVNASEFGDNQLYRFSFKPIKDSQGKTYFFTLRSPESVTKNAITVNINNRDPYPLGTAFIGRQDAQARSGKPTVDTSFSLYHQVPSHVALRSVISRIFTTENYLLYMKIAVAPVMLVLLIAGISLWRKPFSAKKITIILLAIFIGAVSLRLWYATNLPATNDEGNYLYDAWTLQQGTLAGGDGYVKAPLVIAWIAAWQWLLGHTLLIGRLSSVIAGALMIFPFYYIGRVLLNHKAGIYMAALWAFLGAPVVFTIYVHTQPFMMLMAITAAAVLIAALKLQKSWRWFVLAGLLCGLAVVSRKSALALAPAALVLIALEDRTWRDRLMHTGLVAAGFLGVIAVVLLGAYGIYGLEGIWEVIGINSAEDGLTGLDPVEVERARAYSVRGLTPFFRESMPLILLSLLGSGLLGEVILRRFIPRVAKFAWLIPWLVFVWAWQFFFEVEATVHMVFGMSTLWYVMGALLAVCTVWPFVSSRALLSMYIVPVLWFVGLVFFYMNWIKFHANYIGEFLLPLIILSGLALAFLRWHKILLVVPVLLWAVFMSNYVTYVFEHTGTFTLQALSEASAWAEQNIPKHEPIFTGAAIIPYISGHRTVLDIAHPRWYAYEFVRTNPRRLNTFLPPAEEMRQAFKQSQWLLLEEQTSFSFFMEYPDIEKEFTEQFERVHGVSNGSNTLTFYKRVTSNE